MNKDHITTLPKRDLKTRSYNMDMNKKDLKRLSKLQLIIKLLLKQEAKKPSNCVNEHEETIKPIPSLRAGKWKNIKPKPIPQKSVNEGIILPPPEQFRDGYKPIPKPRTNRPLQLEKKEHITDVPVPKIKELNQALKGHAKSYGIELQDNLNPLNHFTKAKALVESYLEDLLKDMKGFKFIEMLEITFMKKKVEKLDSINKINTIVYKMAFFNGKAKPLLRLMI